MKLLRILGFSGIGAGAILLVAARPMCEDSANLEAKVEQKTIQDRIEQYGSSARSRLRPSFAAAKVPYPPKALAIIGLKEEKTLEIQAKDATGKWRHIRDYAIHRASGKMGPKLKRGDLQVPEGIYQIELLNPNSQFHLSLRVNYPNAADRARAREDKRVDLGGDIMIHGSNVSIGCLAMGDPAAEELFVLAHDVGIRNIKVILAPKDLRGDGALPKPSDVPVWVPALYKKLQVEMNRLAPRPN